MTMTEPKEGTSLEGGHDKYIELISQNQVSHGNCFHSNPCPPATPGSHTSSMKLAQDLIFSPTYHYSCIADNACDIILHKLPTRSNPRCHFYPSTDVFANM